MLTVVCSMVCLLAIVALVGMVLLERLVPLCIPKYNAGIPLMKLCLWFTVVAAANTPVYALYAEGRAWLYGSGVLVGLAVFTLCSYLMVPLCGGMIAVAAGSLLGRTARAATGCLEIALLRKGELL